MPRDGAGGYEKGNRHPLQPAGRGVAAARWRRGRQAIFFLEPPGLHLLLPLSFSCHYELYCPSVLGAPDLPQVQGQTPLPLLRLSGGSQSRSVRTAASTDVGFVGFGTEHIEEELAGRFPHIRFARLDADVTAKKNMLTEGPGGLRERGGGCPAGHPDGGQGAELPQAQTGGDHPGGHRPQPPGFPGPGADLRPDPAGGRAGGSVPPRWEGDHPDLSDLKNPAIRFALQRRPARVSSSRSWP
jgi:hypothetical protein